ncbi:MAG: AccI family restriction endonuclease, partial [Bacteroidetes bacterium]
MSYRDEIKDITRGISPSLVDFGVPRVRTSPPTQASSNFITNKEQGDWAESVIFKAINETMDGYVAVRYGRSDNLVAGEPGFTAFYEAFQDELDTIGKRPDLLVFKEKDFRKDLGFDISQTPHDAVEAYVGRAIAGLEIRSSAFLIEKYEAEMQHRTLMALQQALELKAEIIKNYGDLLQERGKRKYLDILNTLNEDTIMAISFRQPVWSVTERHILLTGLFRALKKCVNIVQK